MNLTAVGTQVQLFSLAAARFRRTPDVRLTEEKGM